MQLKKNPLNVAIVKKIRQNSFGAVSPHSSPSCLPGKTFCLHFCDTVAGFYPLTFVITNLYMSSVVCCWLHLSFVLFFHFPSCNKSQRFNKLYVSVCFILVSVCYSFIILQSLFSCHAVHCVSRDGGHSRHPLWAV